MAKLVVLCERDILEYLQKHGVKPFEFYTDLEKVQERAALFSEVHLLVIYCGSTRLSHKRVSDFLDRCNERIKNENDNGILSVSVISDSIMTGQNQRYYYYSESLFSDIDVYVGKNKVDEDDDFWDKLLESCEPCENCSKFLYDSGEALKANVEEYRKNLQSQKSLRSMIKVPRVKLRNI